jgi:peptide/nickel transport system ATP-binding protein
MSPQRRALYLLPEQMPSLRQLASMAGCHFAPRCPIATADCRRIDPPDTGVGAGHVAACLRPTITPQITSDAVLPSPQTTRLVAAPLLQVQGLSKHYLARGPIFGRASEVVAVRNVDLTIAANEFVGLVGESGSGKSTLARLLLGLEQPSGGRILLNGKDVTDQSAQARTVRTSTMQMVFQDPQSALNPRRRVASIVTQAMEAGGNHASWDERCERAHTLLTDMGLPADFATRYPAQLSGGQRQRVNIARALCNVPKILVADEIVSGLDVSIQAQLLTLLGRLQSEFGFAMLFISHDLSVVRHLCSRVLVMYRGEIVEQGPIEQVFADPRHPHTRALLAAVPPDEPGALWRSATV